MPLSTPSRLRATLALSLLLLSSGAAASTRGPGTGFTGDPFAAVIEDDNPFAATFLLGTEAGRAQLARLKAEEALRHDVVFARALELKDLRGLITGGHNDVRALRLGLQGRPNCAFCQVPEKLLAWRQRFFGKEDAVLKAAVYDWATMPPERQAWLKDHASPEEVWRRLTYSERQEVLRGWALSEREALLKADPRTRGELGLMGARMNEMTAVLTGNESVAVWQRYAQAEQAVLRLEEARAKLKGSKDPALQAKLAEAEKAKDLDSRLSALGALFDGARIAAPGLRAQAPSRPDQAFTPESRALVAELVKTGMLAETKGTFAGAELTEFYAKVPMKVAIAPTEGSAVAWYWDGVMSFNERHISEFVKARGKSLDDLARDQALLKELNLELVPVFVHEAVHHRQDVWAKAQGIPSNWSQHQEQEAMMAHALFVTQKAKTDKAYAKFLAAHPDSTTVRQAAMLSSRLEQNGADWFSHSVMADHYPERLSLEGVVWCQIALLHNAIYADVDGELKRRAALAQAERTALESGQALAPSYPTNGDWLAAMRKAKTADLKALVDGQRALLAQQPRIYEMYRARLEEATRVTEERLRTLQSGQSAQRVPPPPPNRKKP
ncbi:MAG: hypothetical protein HYZ75_15710 [Elusimicrobia bacterium]|nr:hypothetical protein [Elusimicrobiota bacterium]